MGKEDSIENYNYAYCKSIPYLDSIMQVCAYTDLIRGDYW